MIDRISVSEDVCRQVQKANVEMEAKRGVLAFMISSGTSLEDENFKRYEESYMKSFREFEEAKHSIEESIVKTKHPDAINWSLDYSTLEITINY